MATQNPITLLISLDANKNVSQQNIDTYVKSLKKYYDRNPLLISLGINKGRLEGELNNLNKSIKAIDVDVNFKGNSSKALTSLEAQVTKIINQIKELNGRLNSLGNQSGSGSNALGRNLSSDIGKAIAEIERLKNSNRLATEEMRRMQGEITRLNTQLNGLGDGTRRASRETNELSRAFSQAFTKFPIWMLASSAFFIPIRGLQDMVKQVVELDSALVNLQRVSDAPLYQFNQTMEQSLVSIRELSGTTKEYMEILNEFARMDNTLAEAQSLANTAQIFTNISDLDAKGATDALIAATIAFNVEKENSISIADKLNEVDNQYSITTRDLALSLNKSAQSSATYGASLDQLVGYTTAIGSATRESGNIIGNSLKTIFSRIGTLSKAQDALSEVGVSVRDSSGEMKDVSVVIDELGRKWNTLSKEAQTYTLVNVAGVYQQNRLAALLNNYQTAIDSTTTSMHSQGSAMREQEKFNESLQGRLNQLNTAWVDLSNSVGQNVMYDGIVVVTKALESMSDGGNSAVSTIGLLPPLFGTAYTAVFLLSSGFRTLTIGMGTATASAIATTVATGSLSAGITALRASVAALGITWKSFLAATGVGLVFVGMGFAIEKLTKVMSENIQMQDKMEVSTKKNMDALTTNSDDVNELISQYNKLSEAKKSDGSWDSEDESEYLRIQQQLADMYPALISHIDSTGQAHIKSKSAIEKEIEATEELIRLKKEETKVKAEDIFQENIKNNKKLNNDIDGNKSSIKQLEKERDSGNLLYDAESKSKLIADLRVQNQMLEMEISASTQEMVGSVLSVADAFSTIKIDSNVTKQISDFIFGLDFSNLDESELKSFSSNLGKIMSDIQKSIDSNDSSAFDEAVSKLNKLASNTKDFEDGVNSFTISHEKLTNSIKNGNVAYVEGEVATEGMTESLEEASGAIQKQVEKLKELSSAHEQIVGVSEAQTKAVTDATTVIEHLGNVSERTEQQEQSLANSISLLSTLYPQLTNLLKGTSKQREQAIAIIESENKANQALLKAYELTANGKMNAEGRATMVHLEETNKRINTINAEIRALDTLQTNYNNVINSMSSSMSAASDADLLRQEKLSMQAYNKISTKQAELASLSGTQTKYTDSLQGTISAIEESEKASKKSSNASSKANKTTKESIYITDQYKQSLEKLNLEIEKQQKLQSTLPDYSNDYKKSLESQIKLEKEKLALIEKQAKSIQSQISSGKIKQTGTITSKSDAPSSQHLSGWNGRITSRYGERADNHRGTDIAGKLGTRFDSNASGKVIAAGNAVKNGYDKSYGNLVVVQGDDGIKRLYAHMEKVLVKIGDQISAGSQIGTIGSTGNSTGPHMHYEEYKNGKLIDSTAGANSARKGKVSGSSGISTVDTGQQAIDQAKSDLISLQNDALNTKSTIDSLSEDLVNSNLSYFNHLISGADKSIEKSNKLANLQLEHSQEYRDELAKEVKHQEYKQSLLHKEANFIREQLKRTDLTPKLKGDLTNQLSELSLSWWDVAEAIDNVKEEIEDSKIAEFDRKIEKLNDTISRSSAIMELHVKGTKEYNDEQKKVISTLKVKQQEYEAEAELLREVLKTEKLTVKAREKNIVRLKELSNVWMDIQAEIIKTNAEIADDLISVMKESYEQQRDYQMALKDDEIKKAEEAFDKQMDLLDEEEKAYEESIKSQMDALDKAHQDKLDKLDEESKAFEDAINRQLELMRKQRDEEDFNKDIGKLQKEESTIISKINELSMDDSREAQLKRKKLEEELANIREQIAEKQKDREYTLREENLQNELDSNNSQLESKKELEDESYNTSKEALDNQLELYKKELEAKKKLEEDKFKATKAQLERERRDIENHFDQLINDEQAYADLRAEIINGSVDGMSEKLSSFLENFRGMNKDVINELGMSWQELENKINRIVQAQGSLGNITVPDSNKDLTQDQPPSNSNNNNSNDPARDTAWQQYLSNKKKWETASKLERIRLTTENNKLRNQYGFQDGSYDELKNIKKYHSGGIVGGKGNRLTELTNKLFNNKPSEETVIALKRELFVPENNVPNMFANIRSAMPEFKTNSPQGGTIRIDNLLSIDNVSQNANLDIDRLLDQSMNRLIDKMKPYGFKL